MYIKDITGNIFSIDTDVIVNAVNTVGIMGGGLALQFKRKYPEMFQDYSNICLSGKLDIGSIHTYNEGGQVIVNFPTKKHWKDPSQLDYIEKGMVALNNFLVREDWVKTVAIPKLGCGLGGLDWNDVKKIIIKKFEDAEEFDERDISVYLVV